MDNYKSKLNEKAHKMKLEVKYEDVACDGPDHNRKFTVRAVLNGKAYPDGVGKNKKEAEQIAARNALNCLEESTNIEMKAPEVCSFHEIKTNYTCWLNEYGQKMKLIVYPEEETKPGPNNTTHWCRYVVGDRKFSGAFGKNKREAKEEAAKLVYEETFREFLKGEESKDRSASYTVQLQVEEKPLITEGKMKSPIEKTDERSSDQTNYKQMLNLHCQQKRFIFSFVKEKQSGPSHSPTFFYKALINNTEYPVAEGKSIKEAEQNAAQMAWDVLKEQSNFESKVSEDVSEAKQSSSSTSQHSGLSKLSSETSTSESVVFEDSQSPAEPQCSDVKPKIRLAANFTLVRSKSKENSVNFDVKDKNYTEVATPVHSVTSRFLSDYDSIEFLGKGAFGYVFKAKHKLEEKYYAIKIVRSKESRKALKEVKVLSDLNHKNIVRYHSCWMQDTGYKWDGSTDSCSASQSSTDSSIKYLYIQMELCDTETLRVWIDKKNYQDPKQSRRDSKRKEESLEIGLQIASGVEHIHCKKLIHRDLKPANILFDQNKVVKIGDFGLVTEEIEDDHENQNDRKRDKGTPGYMAPEQKAKTLYDHKVDIYALGLIYFELLWSRKTEQEKDKIWRDVRNQKFPKEFSQRFFQEGEMIKLMLSGKPEERPEANEIKAKLQEFKSSLERLRDSKTV